MATTATTSLAGDPAAEVYDVHLVVRADTWLLAGSAAHEIMAAALLRAGSCALPRSRLADANAGSSG